MVVIIKPLMLLAMIEYFVSDTYHRIEESYSSC